MDAYALLNIMYRVGRGILKLLFFFILGVGIYKFGMFFYSKRFPIDYQIQSTSFFSDSLLEKINQKIHTEFLDYKNNVKSLSIVCRSLSKQFPIIKKIGARAQPNQTVYFSIEGIKPAFLVNGEMVLGDKKRLFNKNDFQACDFSSLKQLEVEKPANMKLNNDLYHFLPSLPADIYDAYIISYKTPSHIVLIPKNPEESYYQVIADTKSIFDEKKRRSIKKVAQDVIKRDTTLKKKTGSLVLDMRFKNNVVVKRSA